MATSKSIVVVIHSLGGGGAERTLVDLTACWAARGDCVTLVTLSHARDDAYVLHPDINRIVLDVAGESSGLYKEFSPTCTASWLCEKYSRQLHQTLSLVL